MTPKMHPYAVQDQIDLILQDRPQSLLPPLPSPDPDGVTRPVAYEHNPITGTIQQLDQGPSHVEWPPPSDDGGQHPMYGSGDDTPMEGCAWVAIAIGLIILGGVLGFQLALDWVGSC